jgi:hypothetical protein
VKVGVVPGGPNKKDDTALETPASQNDAAMTGDIGEGEEARAALVHGAPFPTPLASMPIVPTAPEATGLNEKAPEQVIEEGDGNSVREPLRTVGEHHDVEVGKNIRPDILLGANEITPQFGLLGRSSEDRVGIDLTGCNTISLFGVQGFGKSYTLGVIAEMATAPIRGINVLPAPLATVIFHYHKSDAYAPEFASASLPNNKVREVERLVREYGATPQGVKDIVLLTPEAKLSERRVEFPGLEIHPIKFSSGELGAESWKFLLGAYDNDSLYVRQLVTIMRRHRENLTLQRFREEIAAAELAPQARRLAEDRLNLAEPYVDDGATVLSGRRLREFPQCTGRKGIRGDFGFFRFEVRLAKKGLPRERTVGVRMVNELRTNGLRPTPGPPTLI